MYSVDRVRLELGLVCLSDQQTIKLFESQARLDSKPQKSQELTRLNGEKGFSVYLFTAPGGAAPAAFARFTAITHI